MSSSRPLLDDLGIPVDDPLALRQVVGVRRQRDSRDWQPPRISHRLVEVDAVLVLRHVVDNHADREDVVEELPIHPLRLRTPDCFG